MSQRKFSHNTFEAVTVCKPALRTVIPIAKILIVVMFARHLAYLTKMLQA